MTFKNLSIHTVFLGTLLLLLSMPFRTGAVSDQIPVTPCEDPGDETGTDYYSIDLISTQRVPGTGQARGKAVVTFDRSPFGISISENGSFEHRLEVRINDISSPENQVYAAWITTPNLDKIKLLGVLDEQFRTSGSVEWNKYLVVITKESSRENLASSWQGPIVMRGMSKSGYMHTMAGHGPFEQDPCAKFGYY